MTNGTNTFDFLWRAARQRREARRIAALLPRIPQIIETVGSRELACRLASQVERWEALVDDPASAVYKVTDGETGSVFAVKCLGERLARRPECVRVFEAEMATTAGLCHPGIPKLHGAGRLADGRLFFVMDFVPGPTLGKFVTESRGAVKSFATRSGNWFPSALRSFAQCCHVVAHAHGRGMVHADLTPSNMILAADRGYVVDWGTARPGGVLPDDIRARVMHPLGTPAYMSPEQAAGAVELDLLSDIYSLGAILYYVLTGQPPIQGQRLPEVVDSICRGDFPTPRQIDRRIPPALDAICQKAMARQPLERFANASELASRLEAWTDLSPLRAMTARWADWLVSVSTPANEEGMLLNEESLATA